MSRRLMPVWPQALAFAAAHPEARTLLDAQAAEDRAQVVLDIEGRRLRLAAPDRAAAAGYLLPSASAPPPPPK